MSPTHPPFWDTVDRIRAERPGYRREAYGFVVAALGHTVESLPAERLTDPERRHLSGQELLRGAVELARREFGLMAPTVFREWGVCSNEDVGTMVFQLVEAGQLSARPEDTLADFRGNYRYNLLDRHVRAFQASTAVFSQWDDHMMIAGMKLSFVKFVMMIQRFVMKRRGLRGN